ncbi:MAG: helix-turn-helix transcriptional regulator [Phycisphaerales bacterium]|nr:helix-turn-helix transcriptional regulator [Hyphomonadaceae bacterium]
MTISAVTLTPLQFGDTLSGAPLSSEGLASSVPILVRRWRGVCPVIEQPPLDHHYITSHLGGPKLIHRKGEGGERYNDIAERAYSVTPAGAAFSWRTQGPVDFAHVYLRPSFIDHVIATEFDRDARLVSLQDALGFRDPLVEGLLAALTDSVVGGKGGGRLYWDGLVHTFVCRLLQLHSTLPSIGAFAPHVLAPFRVNRVIEFVEANLTRDIGLPELAAVAGVSAFHFSRGFRRATRFAPYAFVIHRRLEHAKVLLRETQLPLAEVANACGFGSHSQFSTMFKRGVGMSPTHYRMRR